MIPPANSLDGSEANMISVLPSSMKDKEELRNCISSMLKQEEEHICHDFLKGCKNSSKIVGGTMMIDASCRAKVCKWMFQTVTCAKLQTQTAIVAMSYLDRTLCSNSSLARRARYSRRTYQLAALTCLYIAIKINETVGMDAATFSRLSGGLQSRDAIISCEQDVLKCLRWKMQGPTPLQFVNFILELLPADSTPEGNNADAALKLCAEASLQVELSIQDYACVILRRSSIAIASILNTLDTVPEDVLSSDVKTQFVQTITDAFGIDVVHSPLINAVRGRLLHIRRAQHSPSFISKQEAQEAKGKVYNRVESESPAT